MLTGVTIPATTALVFDPANQAVNPASSAAGTQPGISNNEPSMIITTSEGAAQVVGSEVSFAIDPYDPSKLSIITPPDPRTLRQQVEGATDQLLYLLALLALLIGTVAIANTTLLAVMERVPEIGLRRAVGARPIHIGSVTLVEAAIVGGVGGLIGTCMGVFITAGVALAETWTAVLDWRVVILAPCIGVIAGVMAGTYPAWRATRIEPVTALQR
jgi:putative ABC transport system permease protein